MSSGTTREAPGKEKKHGKQDFRSITNPRNFQVPGLLPRNPDGRGRQSHDRRGPQGLPPHDEGTEPLLPRVIQPSRQTVQISRKGRGHHNLSPFLVLGYPPSEAEALGTNVQYWDGSEREQLWRGRGKWRMVRPTTGWSCRGLHCGQAQGLPKLVDDAVVERRRVAAGGDVRLLEAVLK